MSADTQTLERADSDGTSSLERFLDTVPLLNRFRDGVDTSSYARVPQDWFIGTADVVGSTEAIQHGHYKTVNMIGAGVIAATMNAVGSRDFPFVFGGDGATFVVPPEWQEATKGALAAMRRWASDESDLRLRAALVPIKNVRETEFDVRLARFSPSENVSYAMFAGGGLAWAEREMKSGRYEVPRAPEGVRPDLEGLSCRWQPASAERGDIVSLIVAPGAFGDTDDGNGSTNFESLERRILQHLEATEENSGHPLTRRNIRFALSSRAYDLEARTMSQPGVRRWNRLKLRIFALFAWFLFKFNINFGAFDPKLYREDLHANSDFRKFDDGLKLTLDCKSETADKLEAMLEAAEAAGVANYGLYRQKTALITCIVPSSLERDHIHFVDGGEGGYARAAEQMKKRIRDSVVRASSGEGEVRRQFDDH